MARNKTLLEQHIPMLVELYEKITGKPQAFVFICVDADTTKPETMLLSNIAPPTEVIRLLERSVEVVREQGDQGMEEVRRERAN
jgi:hypothetical protein